MLYLGYSFGDFRLPRACHERTTSTKEAVAADAATGCPAFLFASRAAQFTARTALARLIAGRTLCVRCLRLIVATDSACGVGDWVVGKGGGEERYTGRVSI